MTAPNGSLRRDATAASSDAARIATPIAFLHLAGLTAVAVAQPLYDLLGQNPEFFVAHRASGADIVLLTLGLSLLLPALAVALVAIADLVHHRLRDLVMGGLVATFAALFLVQTLKRIDALASQPGIVLVALAAALGLVAAVAYLRLRALRSFLSVVSIGALAFPLLFLARPSLRGLVWSEPAGAETTGGADTAGGADATGAADVSVVLVVFDQLPTASLMDGEGRIDRDRYPSFAGLAADGVWFRNATAVANKSAWAVPAILTGVYPDPARRLPSWLDYPNSLFTLLEATHELQAFEPVTELCRPEVCRGLREPLADRLRGQARDLSIVYAHVVAPSAWSGRLPALSENWRDFGASAADRLREEYERWRSDRERWNWTERWVERRDSDRADDVLDVIESIGAADEPALYFAHVLLPHEPYVYLPSGKLYTLDAQTEGLQADGSFTDEARVVERTYQRHLLQVAFVDRLLGQILDKLRAEGLYDSSLVIVTADHGASFAPGDDFKDPTPTNFADIASVPLIVKAPGRAAPSVDDRAAATIDVLPTIADYLGAAVPWEVDGRSLAAPWPEPRERHTLYYGAAHGSFSYTPEQMDAKYDTVARKLALFGGDGDPRHGPADAPHADLVGRSVADLTTPAASTGTVELEYPGLLASVDADSRFVPAHIAGSVRPVSAADDEGIDLAIAVNGIVRATTRSLPAPARPQAWSVVLDESAIRPGHNVLEVFRIRSDVPDRRLELAYVDAESDNLVFSAVRGGRPIETRGFYGAEWTGDVRFRWTDGHAELSVPTESDETPAGMEIFVRHVNPEGGRVRVLVNGCEVLRRRMPRAFEQTIAFEECDLTGVRALRIEIVSDTFTPAGRPLGIGVSSLVLLDDTGLETRRLQGAEDR